MSDSYACLPCGDCPPAPCLPPVLPTPEALRTILDVTVHAGECEKVLRAYAEGRLIDGQAIADAYESSLYGENTGKKRLSDLLNALTKGEE